MKTILSISLESLTTQSKLMSSINKIIWLITITVAVATATSDSRNASSPNTNDIIQVENQTVQPDSAVQTPLSDTLSTIPNMRPIATHSEDAIPNDSKKPKNLDTSSSRTVPKDTRTTSVYPEDTRHIPEPKSIHVNVFENGYKRQITDQSIRTLDITRQLKKLLGKAPEAMNVDTFDEVPNSSWFTNRNHIKQMSTQALTKGPHQGDGPDTTGNWTIWRAKADGFAPGFLSKTPRENDT